MTGVGDHTGDEIANESTILPALERANNNMTLLLQESYDGEAQPTWSLNVETSSPVMGHFETPRTLESGKPEQSRSDRLAGQRAMELARRMRTRAVKDGSIGMYEGLFL